MLILAMLHIALNAHLTLTRNIMVHQIVLLVLTGPTHHLEVVYAIRRQVPYKASSQLISVCDPDVDFTYSYGPCENGTREKIYSYVQPTACDIYSEPFLPNNTFVDCGM